IRVAQDRLKERRSALRARHDALRASLGDLAEIEAAERRARERVASAQAAEQAATAQAAAAEATLADVRPRSERRQRERETALELEAELRVVEHQIGAAAEREERLAREVAEAGEATKELQQVGRRLAPLVGLRAEVAVLEHEAEAHATRRGLSAQ